MGTEEKFKIKELSYTGFHEWDVRLVLEQRHIRVEAKSPAGGTYEVWIEALDGELIILCQDPTHDEPLRVRISENGSIVTDDERLGEQITHIRA
ncbi:hypothetical protein NKH55_12145 [Mesorhizobium opportunistum]|uniref:hypothetical protein n=1 Tax=Mesorhizobium opportunistum TaxID=593909 RepID=UPI00333CC8E3